jgi:DNA adenine methylase
MKRVAPAAKIHGGKYYLAPKIIALFPPRTHYINYVESFCGMASVLMAHDPAGKSEVINDADGRVSNFFTVLQQPHEFELFMRLATLTPFSEDQFKFSVTRMASGFGQAHERAFHFFVACRQSRSGNRKQFAPLTKNRLRRGMSEQVSAWLGGIDGLYDVHQRLQRVVIRNCSALELMAEFDNEHTVHYMDPPYHPSTRTDKEAYGNFEMTADDHDELLEAVNGSPSKILLSGYHCPEYDKALKRWDCVEILSPNHVAAGASKRRMVECVWRNFRG